MNLFFLVVPRHAQLVGRGGGQARLLNSLTDARIDLLLEQVRARLVGEIAMRSDDEPHAFDRVGEREAFVEACVFVFQIGNAQMTIAQHVSSLAEFLEKLIDFFIFLDYRIKSTDMVKKKFATKIQNRLVIGTEAGLRQ